MTIRDRRKRLGPWKPPTDPESEPGERERIAPDGSSLHYWPVGDLYEWHMGDESHPLHWVEAYTEADALEMAEPYGYWVGESAPQFGAEAALLVAFGSLVGAFVAHFGASHLALLAAFSATLVLAVLGFWTGRQGQ